MGSYHAGYRVGRAAAEREQRKADYLNARIQAEKEFRASCGRDWNQTERLQFDRDWRTVHLELPSNPLSDAYELCYFIFCIVLLLVVISYVSSLGKALPEMLFAAIVCSAVICLTLLKVYRYIQARKLIEQLGEKAWRDQEIRRQEEKDMNLGKFPREFRGNDTLKEGSSWASMRTGFIGSALKPPRACSAVSAMNRL